jgi:D-alanyl-D-alanine carboxypeptidase
LEPGASRILQEMEAIAEDTLNATCDDGPSAPAQVAAAGPG